MGGNFTLMFNNYPLNYSFWKSFTLKFLSLLRIVTLFHISSSQTSARLAWSLKLLSAFLCPIVIFERYTKVTHIKHLKESAAAFNVLLLSSFLISSHVLCLKGTWSWMCLFPLLPPDCSLLNPNPFPYESSTNLSLMNMCGTDSVDFLSGLQRGWGGGK